MKRQALFLSAFTAVILTLPAFADDGPSGILGFRWGKNVFNFEAMPSGPQPLRNLSRLPNGKANNGRLVGDYHNPILTPEAAAIVKEKGELAIAGKGFPNAQDQCRVMGPPFALAMQLTFAMLPTAGGNITILYDGNMNVRRIRMNGTHPAKFPPSPTGDSISRSVACRRKPPIEHRMPACRRAALCRGRHRRPSSDIRPECPMIST